MLREKSLLFYVSTAISSRSPKEISICKALQDEVVKEAAEHNIKLCGQRLVWHLSRQQCLALAVA
jgi:hypothetical protein